MRIAGTVIAGFLALASPAFGARDVSISGNHLVDGKGKAMRRGKPTNYGIGLRNHLRSPGGAAIERAAARRRSGTKVVCVSPKTSHRIYRKKPRRCTFHKHGEPMAEAFLVRTTHDHWHRWHRGHARGKGRDVTPMGQKRPPVRIRLSHPVHRCGHRVFTRAHFFFPKVGRGSSMRLDACA